MSAKNLLNAPDGFDRRQNNVIYGEVTEREYESKTTGMNRKCLVYTPPGYDPSLRYPVLYLLHGIGGIHTEWLDGAPSEILSNLIAAGEAAPMIAVMPNVRAMRNDVLPQDIFAAECIGAFDNFINDLRDDLMPFIRRHYLVSENRADNAIAGLSMGGREALFVGLKMSETFAYIGAFSPAPGLLAMSQPADRPHPGQMTAQDMFLPEAYRDDTYILMCHGSEEETFSFVSAAYRQAFDDNNVKYTYYVAEGGHDFRVWKNGLYHFAKALFV